MGSTAKKVQRALATRSADGGPEHAHWNVGVKRKLTGALSAALRRFDTDCHSFSEPYGGRRIAAFTYTF